MYKGAVAGSLGDLALEEGIKYEDKIAERVESDLFLDFSEPVDGEIEVEFLFSF